MYYTIKSFYSKFLKEFASKSFKQRQEYEKKVEAFSKEMEQIKLKQRRNEIILDSNIPRKVFTAKTRLRPELVEKQKLAWQYIKTWEFSKKAPYLFGPPGTGKTTMLFYLAYEAIFTKLIPTYYLNMYSLAIRSKIRYSNGQKFSDTLDKAIKCKLLILDDLGGHTNYNTILDDIYYLINYRLDNNLATAISSNYSPVEIKDVFWNEKNKSKTHEVLADRILELCEPIPVKGNSIRQAEYRKSIKALLNKTNAKNFQENN